MTKNKGIWLGIGAVIIVAIAGYAFLAFQNKEKKVPENEGKETIQRQDPIDDMGALTVEKATEIMAEEEGENILYDLFQPYDTNNLIYSDPEAPCNSGTEPLYSFVEKFMEDRSFQSKRVALPNDLPYGVTYGTLPLSIYTPDSTNFFASWAYIDTNTATFRLGYLGSEIVEQYTFSREDNKHPWLLVDYFSAEKEQDSEL